MRHRAYLFADGEVVVEKGQDDIMEKIVNCWNNVLELERECDMLGAEELT